MKLTIPETKYAEFHGYEVKLKDFGHLDSMVKEDRHIWLVLKQRYRYDFQTADLVDGKYCNHKIFEDFHEAVTRPLRNKLDVA